jgi:hypothetical protein
LNSTAAAEASRNEDFGSPGLVLLGALDKASVGKAQQSMPSIESGDDQEAAA